MGTGDSVTVFVLALRLDVVNAIRHLDLHVFLPRCKIRHPLLCSVRVVEVLLINIQSQVFILVSDFFN